MSGKNETDVTVENSDGSTTAGRDINGILPEQHERMLREQADRLRKEQEEKVALVERANEAEKGALRKDIELLNGKIGEFERRLANPEVSYGEYLEKIRDLEKLLEEATDTTAEIGANRIADAKAAMEAGDFDAADEIFAEVQQIEEAAVTRAADAAFGQGLIAEEQVRWSDAARHYARAAKLNETFDTLRKALEFAWRSGAYSSALRWGEDLLAWARKDGTQEQLAVALNEHALTVNEQGRYEEAVTLYRQALEIAKATMGGAHPDYAAGLGNLADVVRAQGRYKEAETLYRQALDISKMTLGEAHPHHATMLNNLAGVLRALGRHEEAEPLFRQALDITKATLGDAHPDYATSLNNLAGVLRALGRHEEAEPLFRQALEIDKATIGEAHPGYAVHLGNLGGLVGDQGRFGEAEGIRREVLEIHRKSLGDLHPHIAVGLNNLAIVIVAQGRYSEAEGLYRQALEIAEESLGPDHPNSQKLRKNLDALLARRPDD